jgi:hypothetical protein
MSKSIFKKRPAAVIYYGLQVQQKFCRHPFHLSTTLANRQTPSGNGRQKFDKHFTSKQ